MRWTTLRHWLRDSLRNGRHYRGSRLPSFRPVLEALEERRLLSTSIPLSATKWTSFGPAALNGGGQLDSGRVTAIAPSPTNSNVIYIATASGGIWRTINAGVSWAPLTDRQATLIMGALAVAPSNPNVIYAGTGEANLGPSKLAISRDNIYYGMGILVSTNGGSSWTLTGSVPFYRRTISRIVVDPMNAAVAYATVGAVANNGLPGDAGVWKTTDGGNTWTDTTVALSIGAPFSDLAMDPSNHLGLYAAIGDSFGNAANGVYKTTDGGTSWARAGNFPTGVDANVGRIALAISRSAPEVLYASIATVGANSALYKMFRSNDGGISWNWLVNTPNYMGQFGDYNTSLGVDPSNPNVVYAGGQAGSFTLIRTLDGGNSWSDIQTGVDGSGPHVDHHAFGFDAQGRYLDGNDGGIWRLDNGTPGNLHWSDLNSNLGTIQFEGLALDPFNPDVAYGGAQDNGTERFNDDHNWNLIEGGDGGQLSVSFAHTRTVYHDAAVASFGGADFFRRSDDGGNNWVSKTSGLNADNEATIFYPPFIMDATNANRLLLGTNRVYETTNQADSWIPISSPGQNGWNTSAAINSLAVAQFDPNGINASGTVYASAAGHIFATPNDGGTWFNADLPGAFNDHVAGLAVNPFNNLNAFAVRDRFTGGSGGHVFMTTTAGQSWQDISSNLPDLPVNCIVLDPRTFIIYIGTDAGVYASRNNGVSWARFETSLPIVRVIKLDLSPTTNILAAGTNGRGMWEVAVAHFSVQPSSNPVAAGANFSVTVSARDPYNRVIPGYRGTIHFMTTDGGTGVVLPGNYTFGAADKGSHTFSNAVRLVTLGTQTLTAADRADVWIRGSAVLTVNSGPATRVSGGESSSLTAQSLVPASVSSALEFHRHRSPTVQATVPVATPDTTVEIAATLRRAVLRERVPTGWHDWEPALLNAESSRLDPAFLVAQAIFWSWPEVLELR